jgi:hypothetical protein
MKLLPSTRTRSAEYWKKLHGVLLYGNMMITLKIPTVNDEPCDFDRLFSLWDQANGYCLHAAFDFSSCHFLRQNAVAFIGGLARLIESRGGRAEFRWNTLQQNVAANLAQNGFLAAFGHNFSSWRGNSIPFREDRFQDEDDVVDYLKKKWLGREWVHVSERLRGEIIAAEFGKSMPMPLSMAAQT